MKKILSAALITWMSSTASAGSVSQNSGTCVSDPATHGVGGGSGGTIISHCPPPDPTAATIAATQEAASTLGTIESSPPPPGIHISCDDPSNPDGVCRTTWTLNATYWAFASCAWDGFCYGAVCWTEFVDGIEEDACAEVF